MHESHRQNNKVSKDVFPPYSTETVLVGFVNQSSSSVTGQIGHYADVLQPPAANHTHSPGSSQELLPQVFLSSHSDLGNLEGPALLAQFIGSISAASHMVWIVQHCSHAFAAINRWIYCNSCLPPPK